MIPAVVNKKAKRGDTLKFEFGFEGVNLSDTQVRIQVRKKNGGPVILDSDTVGTLTNLYANNETRLKWVVPYTETEAILGVFDFDVQITSSSERNTWIEGTLEFRNDITK